MQRALNSGETRLRVGVNISGDERRVRGGAGVAGSGPRGFLSAYTDCATFSESSINMRDSGGNPL